MREMKIVVFCFGLTAFTAAVWADKQEENENMDMGYAPYGLETPQEVIEYKLSREKTGSLLNTRRVEISQQIKSNPDIYFPIVYKELGVFRRICG